MYRRHSGLAIFQVLICLRPSLRFRIPTLEGSVGFSFLTYNFAVHPARPYGNLNRLSIMLFHFEPIVGCSFPLWCNASNFTHSTLPRGIEYPLLFCVGRIPIRRPYGVLRRSRIRRRWTFWFQPPQCSLCWLLQRGVRVKSNEPLGASSSNSLYSFCVQDRDLLLAFRVQLI